MLLRLPAEEGPAFHLLGPELELELEADPVGRPGAGVGLQVVDRVPFRRRAQPETHPETLRYDPQRSNVHLNRRGDVEKTAPPAGRLVEGQTELLDENRA